MPYDSNPLDDCFKGDLLKQAENELTLIGVHLQYNYLYFMGYSVF